MNISDSTDHSYDFFFLKGIGQQVLQAGLVYGIISRGVEITRDRCFLSKQLREAYKEFSRRDPPDFSKVEFKEGNFARAFPDGNKERKPNPAMRDFLLFNDLPESERKSMVVFINNVSNSCIRCYK